MRHFSILIFLTAALCLTSCLFENDMSYPRVDMDIVSFEVEGQVSANIDTDRRHIDVVLGEEVDMSHVKVISIETGEGTSLKGGMPEYLDLREEVSLTVEAYVEAVWTVSASQPVERYIKVGNQIGEAEIDAATRSATVYVSSSQSLKTVLFDDVKHGLDVDARRRKELFAHRHAKLVRVSTDLVRCRIKELADKLRMCS